ncbi:hypothetical protein PYR71_11900 [Rhizobium sp. MC63]|uniref:Uncharacterized protein n=1 Tax=Rhizobium mulingense TaxID=3031128 RepID=A0ACC6MU93_9HYPH|nr:MULTISPECIES: hypothetical protein [unclassified Rhizobium]MDF0697201.1 hypothetical protein [Rhizobium sp. MC63]MEA3516867.1 hypothetical protein [Rhizobium sp. MJ31]MEB3042560.1 hypothetical protein [Rhizobium sp. MJ21]
MFFSASSAALCAQSFALLGTLVGAFTMVIGAGPQTALEYLTHAVHDAALITGLVWLTRRRA